MSLKLVQIKNELALRAQVLSVKCRVVPIFTYKSCRERPVDSYLSPAAHPSPTAACSVPSPAAPPQHSAS